MEPRIGVELENLNETAKLLSEILADEFMLNTNTRNANWNFEGDNFYEMHKFFEEQYEQLDIIIDDIAERIRNLGRYVPATLKLFLELTHFAEAIDRDNGNGFIKELLAEHEIIIIHLRENIIQIDNEFHDTGTSNFITGLLKIHEKMAWMLRAQC